jgi:hypothetical protein
MSFKKDHENNFLSRFLNKIFRSDKKPTFSSSNSHLNKVDLREERIVNPPKGNNKGTFHKNNQKAKNSVLTRKKSKSISDLFKQGQNEKAEKNELVAKKKKDQEETDILPVSTLIESVTKSPTPFTPAYQRQPPISAATPNDLTPIPGSPCFKFRYKDVLESK